MTLNKCSVVAATKPTCGHGDGYLKIICRSVGQWFTVAAMDMVAASVT